YAWGALGHGMAAFALHASPALVPAVAVAISWRRPLLGSVAFTALAAFYAVWSGRLDWAVWISGPLLLVGTLYFCSWRWRSDAAGM
ncbi:MAG TPA: hypothetical protein VNZ57_15610, partial [Longimicrobiales bacterium]|nr:hypothetical protein [Longimicrobiales bacterium]